MYKIEELRKKNDQELAKMVSELKGKLLALRFENATGQLNESHLIKATKKDIAKLFTILNERKNGIAEYQNSKDKITVKKTKKEIAKNENKQA